MAHGHLSPAADIELHGLHVSADLLFLVTATQHLLGGLRAVQVQFRLPKSVLTAGIMLCTSCLEDRLG